MILYVKIVDVFRKTLHWLATKVGLASEGGEDESEDSRFVPSRLDHSVRTSHAGGNAEGTRELDSINEEARELEKERGNH
jgi:hypothetical protein